MLFKEIIEMRHLRKTQCVGDFRHVPLAVLEQYFGLLQNPFGNDLGGGFPGRILHGPVQVVDVDIQLLRKIGGRAQAHPRVVFLDGELPLQQLHEQRRNALRGIYLVPVKIRGGLHFHGEMQQIEQTCEIRIPSKNAGISSGRVLNPAFSYLKRRVQNPAARKDCVILENSH